ncbi:uncharacterized protein [Leptinotarsa decemlineata]|uniref:uncharacterized protein n=1 Tax=Leptinotarsa decemlineata TaxID=7539 RepID=UPI003D30C5A2
MEWTNSACLKLINVYREREVLWNPVHNDYKNKIKKLDAWNDISKIMKGDTGEVKKKMESLLTSFRRERQKQDNSFKTGSGTDTIFKSSWFAFKDMLFLMDKFIPKETKNTEEMVRPRSQHPVEEEEKEETEEEEDTASNANNNDTQETEVPERTTLKKNQILNLPRKSNEYYLCLLGNVGQAVGQLPLEGRKHIKYYKKLLQVENRETIAQFLESMWRRSIENSAFIHKARWNI